MKSIFKRVGFGASPGQGVRPDARTGGPSITDTTHRSGNKHAHKGATGAKSNAQRLLSLLDKDPGAEALRSDQELRRVAAQLVARIEREQQGKVPSTPRKTPTAPTVQEGGKPEEAAMPLEKTSEMSIRHAAGDAASTQAFRKAFEDLERQSTDLRPELPAPVQPVAFDTPATAPGADERLRKRTADANRVAPVPGGQASMAALLQQSERAGTLDGEHPAVIAQAIRNRTRKQQAAVLRTLPGSLARTVQRFLI